MPDFYLDFMTPQVWDALVLATVLIGLALAILRLMKDRAAYDYRQRRRALQHEHQQPESASTAPPLPGSSKPSRSKRR